MGVARPQQSNTINGSTPRREIGITWQNDATDLPMRSDMMRELHNIVKKQQGDGKTLFDMMPRRIQRKVPLIIKNLESMLYLNARSREEYLDKNTLKNRIRRLKTSLFPETVVKQTCTE